MPHARAVVLFPGALGDFICFLPTLAGLRDRHGGGLLLVANPALLGLVQLPDIATASIDRREIADLFVVGAPVASATRALLGGADAVYSWTGFDNADLAHRLAQASGGRVHLYRFRGMQPGEHATAYYLRCVGLASAAPISINQDEEWLARFEQTEQLLGRPLLAVHTGSGSHSKNWQGFAMLIRQWRARFDDAIVMLYGPAEVEWPQASHAGVIHVNDLSLPQVAALLRRSTLYVGNDSGVSHLAGAVGARGVVLFGSTDPVMWAPRGGGLRVLQPAAPCSRCPADVFCVHRLPSEAVMRALDGQRGAA